MRSISGSEAEVEFRKEFQLLLDKYKGKVKASALVFRDARRSKPKQGERVLLRITGQCDPVVGYFDGGSFEVYTDHLYCSCWTGDFMRSFSLLEVESYAYIGDMPE